MKLTVVVTVFNEQETISKAIEQVKALNIEKQIIIVDNCSTDGTIEVLRKLQDPALEIVYQPMNFGYARSVSLGVRLAQGEYVYVHNSDLEYDPSCVYGMLDLAEKQGLDAVFGSRLVNRSSESKFKIIKERPFYLGTIITTFLINLFYGRKLTDIIGARFYRVSSFKKLNLQSSDIGFDFEIASKLCKYNFKFKEVPVNYEPRRAGKKKVNIYDIVPAVLTIFRNRYRSS
jgi:dolichol-phosphate mannosyltransferase